MNRDILAARHEANYSQHTSSFMEGYHYGRFQAGGPYLAASALCFGMALVSFLSLGGGLNWWDAGIVIAVTTFSTPLMRLAARLLFRVAYPDPAK